MNKVSSTRRYKIFRAGDAVLLASAATQWAFVEYANGSLRCSPEEVWRSFEIGAK
ncbi:MAG: hypothetical protein HY288_11955 [Planctomycetia bacterium]|nr:hypothetical protein [Planctomycetia bacterium]